MRHNTILFFDEVNRLESAIRKLSKETESDDNKSVVGWDDFFSCLIMAYVNGYKDTCESLRVNYNDAEVDLDDMEEAIFVFIDGKTCADRFKEHSENHKLGLMANLLRDEVTRVYNLGARDSALHIVNTGEVEKTSILKTWHTMNDERVRDTHYYLEGMTVRMDDEFYTYDGDHAYQPFGFMDPSNNCGCRCYLTYTDTGARESSSTNNAE